MILFFYISLWTRATRRQRAHHVHFRQACTDLNHLTSLSGMTTTATTKLNRSPSAENVQIKMVLQRSKKPIHALRQVVRKFPKCCPRRRRRKEVSCSCQPWRLYQGEGSRRRKHSSGAVWESRWTSWAVRPNESSGFRGRKDLLNRASALVTTCP